MPNYVIYAANTDGTGHTGLSPLFTTYRLVDSGADLSSSAPTISELGLGWYKIPVAEKRSTCGAIDLGVGPATRYLWCVFSKDNVSIQPYFSDRGLIVRQ